MLYSASIPCPVPSSVLACPVSSSLVVDFLVGGDDGRRPSDVLINLRFLMRLVAEATGPDALAWLKRANLWRERTNPRTPLDLLKRCQPEGRSNSHHRRG